MFVLKIVIMSVMLAFPSFAEEETLLDELNSEVTPEKIHEMGDKLIEELKNFKPEKLHTEFSEESSEVRHSIHRENMRENSHNVERHHHR